MKAMAVTDPLTRCYNRRLLYEIAEHELEQHRRYKLPLSILYIDIDHFKAINDTRGHHTGDEVLKTMGAILRELTRQADYVFRWGGDEFVVLLSAAEAGSAEQGEARSGSAFLESAIVSNLPDGVDVSIGCVPVPPETKDFDPLIDQADREMYRASEPWPLRRGSRLRLTGTANTSLAAGASALRPRSTAPRPPRDLRRASRARADPRVPNNRHVFVELVLRRRTSTTAPPRSRGRRAPAAARLDS